MEITTERNGETLIARADGRVDGANARDFQNTLEAEIDEGDRLVLLDLEQLTYISSAGLRVILLVAKALRRQGASFAVCSLSDTIGEVFEVSGFDKIIPIHSSPDDALAAFSN